MTRCARSGDVFEFLDLPRLEHDTADLVATRQHMQLTFELPSVPQHREDIPAGYEARQSALSLCNPERL